MTIANRVKTVLARDFDVDDVANERVLVAELAFDSLDLVELGMSIEDEFSIVVEDDEVKKLSTIGDVITLVEKKLALARQTLDEVAS